jgi:hypothetical protein
MIRPRREEDLERCVALLRRVHAIAFYERRGWLRVGSTELTLSAEPWRLPLCCSHCPERRCYSRSLSKSAICGAP